LLADHKLPSKGGDAREYRRRLFRNARLAANFLEILTDPRDSDFGNVHVTHHYDHGHYTLPGGELSRDELLREPEFLDFFSSVMFDDTHSPFEKNVEDSIAYRKFLEAQGRRKVLEGCLEEVPAGGKGLERSAFTDPAKIREYLERTGFDLVVPNIGTESIHAKAVGVQWEVLTEIQKLGVGQKLIVHGFSSIRTLPVEKQRQLGPLGVVGMNAWSYIPQSIGPKLLDRAELLRRHRDPEKGFPVGFTGEDQPVYDPSKDANVFFGPVLDQVRDLKVRSVADSVYEILDNLGYGGLS